VGKGNSEKGIVEDFMVLKGNAWKFGDDISTDLICPGRYFHLRSNLEELAKHVLEDADPQFVQKMGKGDFVVAGNNFGLGSSREHAPTIIKIAGVSAVLAKSFARIFYRNAINIGLPLVECDTDRIEQGDELEIDLEAGLVKDKTKGIEIKVHPLPRAMINILNDGGLLAHIEKHGDFKLD
jgi:3-isopropylmalate/(R)-2-methylmalate dehydratase small subunit